MEDKVVQEIDVYLVKDLSEQLYVLQYPLRTESHPYAPDDDSATVSFQWRPIQQHAKMSVTRDVDGEARKLQLESTQMPMKCTYGVCSFEEADGKAECYITPLVPRDVASPAAVSSTGAMVRYKPEEAAMLRGGGILQLTPDFSELNAPDLGDGSGGGDDSTASQLVDTRAKNQKQQVSWELTQSKFVRTYVRITDFDEPYLDMEYHHANTDEACDMKDRLVPNSMDVKPARTLPHAKYIKGISRDLSQLAPPKCVSGICTVHSLRDLALIPVDQQVLHIMHCAEIVSFYTVKEMVVTAREISDHQLIHAIDKIAVLVRGAWVIDTERWYEMSQGSRQCFKDLTLRTWIKPNDKKRYTNPPKSPVARAAEERKACRNHVLLRLHQAGYLTSQDIEEVVPTGVSVDAMQAMMAGICALDELPSGEKVWRLKMEDERFQASFPDHVNRAAKAWQVEKIRLKPIVKHDDKLKMRAKEAHDVKPSVAATAVDAMDVDVPAPVTSLPFMVTPLHTAVVDLLVKHHVLQGAALRELLEREQVPFTASAITEVRRDVTQELHGVFVLKASCIPESTLVEQLHWDAVVKEFRQSVEKGRSALNRAVSQALGDDYSNRIVGDVLTKLAAKKDRIKWVLKDGHADT